MTGETGEMIVLASRSPQRRAMLSLIVPPAKFVVRPPANSTEAGFQGLASFHDICERVRQIAEAKRAAVAAEARCPGGVIAADTVIVVEDPRGGHCVLGQPPDWPEGREVVRNWFETFYLGRTHYAVSAVAASNRSGETRDCVVTTQVAFSRDRAGWLDWYLDSGESEGKAGGYGLQGLASVFVDRIEGSLSNVVGLPLAETRALLIDLGMLPSSHAAGR